MFCIGVLYIHGIIFFVMIRLKEKLTNSDENRKNNSWKTGSCEYHYDIL